MHRLFNFFMIIFTIWGFMIFVNAPEVAMKIIGCVVGALLIKRIIKSKYNSILEKRKAKKNEEYKNHLINANKIVGDQLAKQFNAPISKSINYAHERYIFISEVESLIMVDGIIFNYTQLLNCELEDNQRNFSTTTTTEKKQSSSYIDWVINTDAGRIVDAINAPVTRSVNTTSKTIHDYTLKLTLNSFVNPYILIPLGDDEEVKNYLKGIFDVIIYNNKDK